MDDTRSEHPDEGMIHAWLDEALDEPAASRVAAHVATCGECAERVAEARGLIAGASRVVRALDAESTPVGPAWGQATAPAAVLRPPARSTWRALRVTPARAAIAATLLVALGVTFTSTRTAVETDATRAMSMSPAAEGAPEAGAPFASAPGAAVPAIAAPSVPARDAVLDSAIARNVAEAQPPRAVGAAKGVAIPVPSPAAAGARGLADPAAATRVAAGRGALQEQRDSGAGIAADQLVSRRAGDEGVSARAVTGAMAKASVRADSASGAAGSARSEVAVTTAAPTAAATAAAAGASASSMASEAAAPARRRVLAGPRECYSVERATAGAGAWGPVRLPFVLAINADGQSARILTTDGTRTDATASLTRGASDSLFFRLTSPGYQGSIDVGAAGAVRAGVMRSSGTVRRDNDAIMMPAVPIVASLTACSR